MLSTKCKCSCRAALPGLAERPACASCTVAVSRNFLSRSCAERLAESAFESNNLRKTREHAKITLFFHLSVEIKTRSFLFRPCAERLPAKVSI